MNILDVKYLKIWDIRDDETIVEGVSFTVPKGKCVAVVGESGSGKSMTIKSVSKIHEPWIITEGDIIFDDKSIIDYTEKEMNTLRGTKIFIIFQEAMSSFDPSMKIKAYVCEILSTNLKITRDEAYDKMLESMKKVSLKNPEEIMTKFPHQLSGGMLQRIIIAIALSLEPELIIADEPTTALDTITQYEVVDEFRRLVTENGISMIFISHDLGVVRKLADEIVVMRKGKVVEKGTSEEIFSSPKSEYTKYLIGTRKALGDNYRNLMSGKEIKYA